MTAKDVMMLAVVFPALVVPLWIVVLRVWRQGRDIYDQAAPVKWVTPEAARHGYHAFLLPAAVSISLSGPVTAAYVVWESGSLQWLGDAFIWLYAVCFGLVLLGFLAVGIHVAPVPGATSPQRSTGLGRRDAAWRKRRSRGTG